MGRSRTRISRGLIGALVVVIALGVVFYFHNTSRTKANALRADVVKAPAQTSGSAGGAQREPAIITAPAPPAPASPAPPAPTTAPSTQPSGNLAEHGMPPFTQTALLPTSSLLNNLKASPTTSIAPVDPRSNNGNGNGNKSAARPSVPSSSNPLADGKARADAGDLLNARRIVNDALVNNRLSDADATAAKDLLSQVNQTIVFSPKRFADDELGGTYSVQTGDLMKKIAANHDVTVELLCRLNNLSDPRRLRAGATIKVIKGPFHALVSKHNFTIELWLG